MRSTEIGQPDDKVRTRSFFVREDGQSSVGNQSSLGTSRTQFANVVMPFKENAITTITRIQADHYMITAPSSGLEGYELWLVPGQEGQVPDENYINSTLLAKYVHMMQVVTAAGIPVVGDHEEADLSEVFNDNAFKVETSALAGLWLFGASKQASRTVNCTVRIEYTRMLLQRYFSDNYFRDGDKIDEGWAGHEFEESMADGGDVA